MKLGPVVQEEMSFKEKVYTRTDGRRTKTVHNRAKIKSRLDPLWENFLDPRITDNANADISRVTRGLNLGLSLSHSNSVYAGSQGYGETAQMVTIR